MPLTMYAYPIQNPLLDVVAIDTLHPDALIEYQQVLRGMHM